jgi:molybdenum cofactor cytidylyltransferase
MGRAKLALPLGGRTVIERVVTTLREGGLEHVLVVSGPHIPELISLAVSAGAELLALPEPTSDMRSTVERGLDWIERHYSPSPDDCWLLAPGDHPAFSAGVVRLLLEAARATAHSIVVPTHDGRRGHPVLMRWRQVQEIRALPPNEGINAFIRSHTAESLELPVADPGILANLDTPEDYERLRSGLF